MSADILYMQRSVYVSCFWYCGVTFNFQTMIYVQQYNKNVLSRYFYAEQLKSFFEMFDRSFFV